MGFSLVRARANALLKVGLKRSSGSAVLVALTLAAAPPAHSADVVAQWVMPIITLPADDQPHEPDIFGTFPLPLSPRPTSTRWAKLMHASLAQPALVDFTQGAVDLPPQQQLAYVQAAVNHAVHTPTAAYNCSDDGYWAPASETLARGLGDCFDVAIAKMEALRLLGIPDKDFYLTTGRVGSESGRGRETVALLVRIDDHFSLLTEKTDRIIGEGDPQDGPAEFTPVLTYGVGMTWLHGRLVKLAALAK